MARKNLPGHQPYNPVDAAFVRSTPTVFSGPKAEEQQQRGTTENVSTQANEDAQRAQEEKATKLTKYARYLTSEAEFQDLQRFANLFSIAAGTTVELGKIIRVCNTVMLHAEKEILEAVKTVGPLKRPRNDDSVGIADFEHRLAQIFVSAFRKSQPIR